MPIINDNAPIASADGAVSEILDKNLLTTAGVGVALGTGVAGVGILVTALPGQMAAATALSGGLIYAGHRQSVGKPIVPGFGKSDDKADDKPSEAAA